MKFVDNYVDCKLFGVREALVLEHPENEQITTDKLFTDDTFKANLSYVYWTTTEQPLYKVKTPAGNEGYVRTDVIQLATK